MVEIERIFFKMNSELVLIAVCYLFSATLSIPVQNGTTFIHFSIIDVPALIVNKFLSIEMQV